ncbi:hypothetical protein CsSME_00001238 [Camellia sinensis var. sinensis]
MFTAATLNRNPWPKLNTMAEAKMDLKPPKENTAKDPKENQRESYALSILNKSSNIQLGLIFMLSILPQKDLILHLSLVINLHIHLPIEVFILQEEEANIEDQEEEEITLFEEEDSVAISI